jgi:hypothetical protein
MFFNFLENFHSLDIVVGVEFLIVPRKFMSEKYYGGKSNVESFLRRTPTVFQHNFPMHEVTKLFVFVFANEFENSLQYLFC